MATEERRELDIFLAENLFKKIVLDATHCTKDGEDPWIYDLGQGKYFFGPVHYFSSDLDSALKILEWFLGNGLEYRIVAKGDCVYATFYHRRKSKGGDIISTRGVGKAPGHDLPLAISLAARACFAKHWVVPFDEYIESIKRG